jgi:hypothetical protein
LSPIKNDNDQRNPLMENPLAFEGDIMMEDFDGDGKLTQKVN